MVYILHAQEGVMNHDISLANGTYVLDATYQSGDDDVTVYVIETRDL